MKKATILFIIIFLFSGFLDTSYAQSDKNTSKRKKELVRDHMLFNSAQGRDFWFAIPPNEWDTQPYGNTEEISVEVYKIGIVQILTSASKAGFPVRDVNFQDYISISYCG